MLRFVFAVAFGLLQAQSAIAANSATSMRSATIDGNALPVDVATAYGAKPVWAHSLFRAMSANYNGPLFQVWSQAGGVHTVYPAYPGGPVNMADLQSFCSGANLPCFYRTICDQISGGCTANGDNALTFGRPATITNASPGVIQPSTSAFKICDAMNTSNPFYLETTGTLPTGLSPDTLYYVVGTANNHACNAGTGVPPVTWNAAATPGGTAINTSSAGSGTHTAYIGGLVTYSHLPNGTKIPIYSSGKSQPARNRAGTVNLPNPGPGFPLSVYALFGTAQSAPCCGTYGLMETTTKDTNPSWGAMLALGLIGGGPSSYEGAPCVGTGPWLGADLENGVACTDGGQFTMSSTTTAGTILHITSSQIPAWCIANLTSPAVNVPIIDITNPSSIPAGTTVNACSNTGNTLTVCVPPGVPPSCTGGGNVTVASGDVLYVGNPQPTVTAGFLDAYVATNAAGNNHDIFQMWLGGENANYPINYANQIPTAKFQGASSYGLSLGEGGDGSDSPAQWYEGMGTKGMLSQAAVQAIHANLIKTEWQGPTRTGATGYDFTNGSITNSSLPAGWSFSRAGCSGTGVPSNCYTDALYTDTAGRTPNYLTSNSGGPSGTGQMAIGSNGLMLMTQHVNYVGGTNAGSDCNQQPTTCLGSSGHTTMTTASLGTSNNYVLICNGTGSVTSAAGTAAGSGFGTYNCGSTPQVIHITGAGTITLTTSTDNTTTPGAFNWIDLQDQSNTAGAGGAKNHINCASTSTPPCTAQTDKLTIGSSGTSKEYTILEGYPNTVVVEHKALAIDNLHLSNQWGPLVGTSSGSPPMLTGTMNATNYYIYGPNTAANAANIATTPALNATHRAGFTFGQMMNTIAYDGLNTLNGGFNPLTYGGPNTANTHLFDAMPSGVTHYLGWDGWANGACNCYIRKVGFYPYYLGRYELNLKTAPGAPLP